MTCGQGSTLAALDKTLARPPLTPLRGQRDDRGALIFLQIRPPPEECDRCPNGNTPRCKVNQFFRKAAGVALMAPAAEVARLKWARRGVCVFIMLERLWRDQGGASLIDYAILAALITVLIVVGIAVAGGWAQAMWTRLLPLLG